MLPTDVSRTGIMFDPTRGAFPTLAHLSYDTDPVFGPWLVIATDPTIHSYSDDAQEAMDETNWATILDALPEGPPEEINSYHGPDMTPEVTAVGYGLCRDTFDTYLIVSPENSDLIDTMAEFHGALEGYPLLDEDAYSEREYDAWQEWVMTGGLEYDTCSELIDLGADEDTVDLISDQWSDIAPIVSSRLDYSNGFYGECSPEFHVAVAEAIAQGIGAALLGGMRVRY